MFGDMMGMMEKLKAAKAKIETEKEKMANEYIRATSRDRFLVVEMSLDRKVRAIEIDESLLSDKEQLEDYLVTFLNKALEKAGSDYEKRLAKIAKEDMPNIPGLGNLMK